MTNNKRPIELGYNLSASSYKNIQLKTKTLEEEVATVLREKKNICFENERIKFPEMSFSNIEEALKYLREQENLLLQKNREDSLEAVKEITKLL